MDFNVLLLLVGCLVAATLASVTGFGGTTLLLPFSVWVFGVEDAVPIMTITSLAGNASRVWLNWRDISLTVTKWFALGCIPAAILGGFVFANVSAGILLRPLGVFLILVVLFRRLPRKQGIAMPLHGFVPVGAASGFFSAILGSVGPLVAPFFLAYGLTRGAYIGTEALSAAIMHITKTATYGSLSVLTHYHVGMGLLFAPTMVLGSYVGKRIVDKMPESRFATLIDATLVISGLQFVLGG